MTENKRIDIILKDGEDVVDVDVVEQQAELDESIPFLKPLKKCGEVFMESAGELIFVCTLCSEHFNNLQIFGMHLYDNHIHEDDSNGNREIDAGISTEACNVSEAYRVGDKNCNSAEDTLASTSDGIVVGSIDLSGVDECDIYTEPTNAKEIQFDNSSQASSVNEDFPANYCDVQHYLPNEDQLTFVCKQCGVTFQDDPSLQKHIKHEHPLSKILECPYCDKTFTKVISQQSHINMHTGYRPYTCKYCPRAFTMKSSLRVHTKTHFETPSYSCIYCGKRFFQNYERKRHETVHIKDRRYKCEECGKMFLSNRYLLPHIRRHIAAESDDKLYECDICGDNLSLLNLYWHKKDHEKSKCTTTTSSVA